jgi:hypothetical protein
VINYGNEKVKLPMCLIKSVCHDCRHEKANDQLYSPAALSQGK